MVTDIKNTPKVGSKIQSNDRGSHEKTAHNTLSGRIRGLTLQAKGHW
jgi:hypothetical protein